MTLLNLGPAGVIEHIGRVVPAGSDDDAVYMRSLRHGEEDTGEVVHVPAGKRMVIRAGDLSIDWEELDAKDADENYLATCGARHPVKAGSPQVQLATLYGSLS